MNITKLTEADRTLLQHAIDATDRLYVPATQEVGAAVRTAGGQIYAGIHFETATGLRMCVARLQRSAAWSRRAIAIWRPSLLCGATQTASTMCCRRAGAAAR